MKIIFYYLSYYKHKLGLSHKLIAVSLLPLFMHFILELNYCLALAAVITFSCIISERKERESCFFNGDFLLLACFDVQFGLLCLIFIRKPNKGAPIKK